MALFVLNDPAETATNNLNAGTVGDHTVLISSSANAFTNNYIVYALDNFTSVIATAVSSNFSIHNSQHAFMRGGNGIVTAGTGGNISNSGAVVAYADDGIRVQGGSANVHNFSGGIVKGISDAIEFAAAASGFKVINRRHAAGKTRRSFHQRSQC